MESFKDLYKFKICSTTDGTTYVIYEDEKAEYYLGLDHFLDIIKNKLDFLL